MHKIARAASDERRALFHNTAIKMGLSDAIVEKDFWVCWALNYLFHHSPWQHGFAFKGGTSLSKCYGLIKRFSEDIDLILDWRLLGYSPYEPWDERSKTQQAKCCDEINRRTANFLNSEFIPTLRIDFGDLLSHPFAVTVDENDQQTVCFDYPKCFQTEYVLSTIRLEVGALAAWTPALERNITPYSAEVYARLFEQRSTNVLTVSAERTFWEKATILHKEAFRTNGNLPGRYSRHYYDLYCMAQSPIKESAFADLELLRRVVEFKSRFYPSNIARYDLAKPGTMRLMPPDNCIQTLSEDYVEMTDMIFGEHPEFEQMMKSVQEIETAINKL